MRAFLNLTAFRMQETSMRHPPSTLQLPVGTAESSSQLILSKVIDGILRSVQLLSEVTSKSG